MKLGAASTIMIAIRASVTISSIRVKPGGAHALMRCCLNIAAAVFIANKRRE